MSYREDLMRAVTVAPGTADRCGRKIPEPDVSHGSVLVEAPATGVCGTDAEIAAGDHGWVGAEPAGRPE
jgi:D-arabinose 1-dehydrogenase-like Zn-dependent alcohol dehydrogenase